MTTAANMMTKPSSGTIELRFPALEIEQSQGRKLYSFAVDGKSLARFATVSRIRRDQEAEIHGYQRPEVLSHISEIRRYLESANPMIPNALVVAFDHRVWFEASMTTAGSTTRSGEIVVP